jgi:hypothetical protein
VLIPDLVFPVYKIDHEPGDVIGKGMESANNDARKWPILPFDVSQDFIINSSFSSRISRNFSLDHFLT